jgi:hypothetical protein
MAVNWQFDGLRGASLDAYLSRVLVHMECALNSSCLLQLRLGTRFLVAVVPQTAYAYDGEGVLN